MWAQTSAPGVSPIQFADVEYLGNSYLTADISMRIQNKNVTAVRTNSSNGVNCTYTGIISPSGTQAQGQVTCDHGYPIMAWTAEIYINKDINSKS